MFSRYLVAHKGLSNATALRLFAPTCVQRTNTTESQPQTINLADPNAIAEERNKVALLLKQELPKPYDGPERDLVNFPRRVRAENIDKVRMAFIPDSWFQFFYKKTGVTGPYLFGTGLITFLVSKEWYVIEHEFSSGCALFLLIYFGVKKFGSTVSVFMDGQFQASIKKYDDQKMIAMKNLEDAIDNSKKNVWHSGGQKILFEAKRENIQMQLETEYRKRMMNVYEQVKKRLDYQLDMYNTQRKLEQKHMVDWIVNSVVKSITPQQEKEALQKCIEDLKVLSSR